MIAVFMVLAVVATACSKSDSPAGPSSSTPPPSGGTTTGSASISGIVLTGSSTAVKIVGTSISATVDGSGHFTLNAPSGDLTLAFSGNGIDAQLTLSGVADREQIRISVNLNGHNADLDDNERETPDRRAEVEGSIVSIACGDSSSTLVIGRMMQTTVIIPAGTPIRHDGGTLTCAQLVAGMRAHVKGMKNGTTVTATEIRVEGNPGPGNPGPPPPPINEVEVKGTVSAIASRSCATGVVSFTLMTSGTSVSVTTNASTVFEETTCATLAVNDKIEVKGTRQGNSVLATKVEGEDDDRNDDRNKVELKGTLGAWDTTKCSTGVSSTVSGKAFSTNASTRFKDTTCAGLKQGDSVEVEGTAQAGGSVLAATVEKKK
jgi:hypothetical protein